MRRLTLACPHLSQISATAEFDYQSSLVRLRMLRYSRAAIGILTSPRLPVLMVGGGTSSYSPWCLHHVSRALKLLRGLAVEPQPSLDCSRASHRHPGAICLWSVGWRRQRSSLWPGASALLLSHLHLVGEGARGQGWRHSSGGGERCVAGLWSIIIWQVVFGCWPLLVSDWNHWSKTLTLVCGLEVGPVV